MDLNKYLTDTFEYNDKANKQVLAKAAELPEKEEFIRFFSHLINCQFKWMARVVQNPDAQKMDWWNPVYSFEELASKWDESLRIWLDFIASKTEEELLTEVDFVGFDGTPFATTPCDIALQLNYHSIHHRAQIQTLIRQQGLTPDFVDYIGTKYRKLA